MIFWVEASQNIGMGHLKESIYLADYFRSHNYLIYFIINPYLPAELALQNKKIEYLTTEINHYDKIVHLIKKKSHHRCIIINHWNVSFNALEILHQENFFVVVIDHLGNKSVLCDVLINRSIVPEWLKYEFVQNTPVCCFGSDYAILDDAYEALHKCEKKFSTVNNSILVSMGGVDRSGATLRIIEALKFVNISSKIIILGPGFPLLEKLKQIRMKLNNNTFHFFQGINNLGEMMQKADIVISAGGNTLYEMACIGTPGIVLWEDQHEYILGKTFSEKGVALCLGNGMSIPEKDITRNIHELLKNIDRRKDMSQCGKKLIDYKGRNRIMHKIKALIG